VISASTRMRPEILVFMTDWRLFCRFLSGHTLGSFWRIWVSVYIGTLGFGFSQEILHSVGKGWEQHRQEFALQ
jgi:hypothetical protein